VINSDLREKNSGFKNFSLEKFQEFFFRKILRNFSKCKYGDMQLIIEYKKY